MDMQYLLFWQEIRNHLPAQVEGIAAKISDVGAGTLIVVLAAVLYWCIQKEAGTLLLGSYTAGHFINNLIKQTCCIFRPWIRDARVVPSEAALSGATGYSFPSGHSVSAASVYGGGALLARKRSRLLAVLSALLMIVILFTRNFLGVHTPQDVLVGCIEGLLVFLLLSRFQGWIRQHPEKDKMVLLIGLAAVAAALAYLCLKPYPVVYVEGELVADPADMMHDGIKTCGAFAGMLSGWFLERRFVRFTTDCSGQEKVMRAVTGIVLLLSGQVFLKKGMYAAAGRQTGGFLYGCAGILLVVFVIPLIHRALWNLIGNRKKGSV